MATSSFTLPVAAIISTLLWFNYGWSDITSWYCLAITGLSAYILVELNNSNALIRIRSRLTTSTFVVVMAIMPFLHRYSSGAIVALCLLCSYHLLFMSYQKVRAEGYIFHAFLFIGIGVLFFPQMLYLAPIYYLTMIVQLRSFSIRSFFAGIIGLSVPFWFYAGYLFYFNRGEVLMNIIDALGTFQPIRFVWEEHQLVNFAFIATVVVFSMLHFWHTNFNDKIRTRMLFYILILLELFIGVFLALQPQHYDVLIRMFILTGSPIIAHAFALSHTRFSNFLFIITLLLTAVLYIYNLWIPSFSSL